MKNTYILSTPATVIGTYSSLANAKAAIKEFMDTLVQDPAAFEAIVIKPQHPYHFTIRVVPLNDEPITSVEEVPNRINIIKASIVMPKDYLRYDQYRIIYY